VLRQDPDVIFVGEIRDADSAMSAIQAAQTGHLVVSTMHTTDATETVRRFVELFPNREQDAVRAALAGALHGIVSQRLLERLDGRGRIPAVEILVNNGRVTDRIVDPDAGDLQDVIAEGRYDGMQTFDQALIGMVQAGLVSEDDARAAASNPHDLALALAGAQRMASVTQGG
jgi:twitching motility protein PilT